MAAPVYFPADPGIGEPEIAAEDRVVRFTDERSFLLRESTVTSRHVGGTTESAETALVA